MDKNDSFFSSYEDLSLMYFNGNSILGKLDLIKALVETYSPDIIAITETKIDNKFDDNELLGPDFTVARNDRKQGGGGVLIATRNDCLHLHILNTTIGPGESIILTLSIHSQYTLNLVTFYRPPSEQNLENITQLLNGNDLAHPVIMVGDFNLSDLKWPSGVGSIKPTSNRKYFHKEAVDLFKEHDFYQLINEPTHKRGNILDLVFVASPILEDFHIKTEVLPGISDHSMILIGGKLQDLSLKANRETVKVKYNFKKAKYPRIKEIFYDLHKHFEHQSLSVPAMWAEFTKAIDQSVKNYVPSLLPRPKGKPWMTRELLRLIRWRKRIFDRCKKYPSHENVDLEARLGTEVKKEVRRAKTQFLRTHVSDELKFGNTKPLYNLISRARGQANQISSLESTPKEQIADKLAQFFASVYSIIDVELPFFEPKVHNSMENIRIAEKGVLLLIQKLEKRKASGPDEISPYLLKEFSARVPHFIPCLTKILNHSLCSRSIPNDWKLANICPVYKNGKRDQPGNYRPISLTSVVSKILEHIIVSSMWIHINGNKLLITNQHGFRSGLNTTTQLLHVIHKATEAADQGRDYHLVSFDFAKAFDKVPHKLLIHKLSRLKFSTQITGWVEEWLRGRTSVVTVNGLVSAVFPVTSGVPQGSVLGPLLFLLYINDLPQNIIDAECRLYADDTLLCMAIDNGGPSLLQQNIDTLGKWSDTWGMKFNPSKCVHLRVGRRVHPDIDLTLNGVTIPKSSSVKYLGVNIHESLKWTEHVVEVAKKANKTLGMLRRCLSDADPKTCMLAYNSIVRPTLEYASQVWSPHTKCLSEKLEKIQRRAIRWAYRISRMDSVCDEMSNHDILSLSDRRDELDLRFLVKIQVGEYYIELKDYIRFNATHNTRGKTINPHFSTNIYKFSFYNRMRSSVKVFFE